MQVKAPILARTLASGGRIPSEGPVGESGSSVDLIQALIPLGLEEINELLQREVAALAGPRYRLRERQGETDHHRRQHRPRQWQRTDPALNRARA